MIRYPNLAGPRQVAELNDELLALLADRLDSEPQVVRQALSDTLEELMSPTGGVLLIWWDNDNGLRMNPVAYREYEDD